MAQWKCCMWWWRGEMLSTSDASSPERALDVGRRRGARAGLAASTVAVRHGREVVGRLHTAVHAAPQCFNASTLGTGCSSPPPPGLENRESCGQYTVEAHGIPAHFIPAHFPMRNKPGVACAAWCTLRARGASAATRCPPTLGAVRGAHGTCLPPSRHDSYESMRVS